MLKMRCERAIRALYHEWRSERTASDGSPAIPCFDEFYQWLSQYHPQTLTFKKHTHVPHWVRHWFDQESRHQLHEDASDR
jgi:hypothetical protein